MLRYLKGGSSKHLTPSLVTTVSRYSLISSGVGKGLCSTDVSHKLSHNILIFYNIFKVLIFQKIKKELKDVKAQMTSFYLTVALILLATVVEEQVHY